MDQELNVSPMRPMLHACLLSFKKIDKQNIWMENLKNIIKIMPEFTLSIKTNWFILFKGEFSKNILFYLKNKKYGTFLKKLTN